jgi:hypothetical protein
VTRGHPSPKKRAVGFKLSEGMEVPAELASRFKFATGKSKLAGTIRGSYFAFKKRVLTPGPALRGQSSPGGHVPRPRAPGTGYAESTVFKTMQRMKDDPKRPPTVRLERSGTEGFRIAESVGAPGRPAYPAYWGGLLPGPAPLLDW